MLKKRLGVILQNTGNQREECEANLREARLRNGLSPTKKMADGYFTSTGVWVELSGSEKNLDDAFEKDAINKRLSIHPR